MRRTPALRAAAAALGLLAGLGLEARASTLEVSGEVSPHTVSLAWLTPGAPSPAGVEMDGPGAWTAPRAERRITRLPPMRARANAEHKIEHAARHDVHRKRECESARRQREAETRILRS